MDSMTVPEARQVERFPMPPADQDFAVLHRHLTVLRPLLTGWTFHPSDEEGSRPGVSFAFGAGFTGKVALEDDAYLAEVYTGACPMDADALRIMLRHKPGWRWMTRGVIAGDRVFIYLNVRHARTDGLEDLTEVILSGIEMAHYERGELNGWWNRTRWAQGETQA